MNNLITTNNTSGTGRWLHRLAAVWNWLIEPSPSIIQAERRLQARLLMAMLLVLMSLGLVFFILSMLGVFSVPGEPKTGISVNDWITLAAGLLFPIEYSLSRTRYYPIAAVMMVAVVLSATFAGVIVSPQDTHPLFFLILGGLIASLFLSARMTALVFLITAGGLLALPIFVAGFSRTNYINAFFFILTVGGVVVIATSLRQHYLDQIDWQTQQLIENETRLRELSIRDPLTRLFNRRYLEEMLTVEMMRAERKGYSIGIIMADIDHFKRFNDRHGHAAGDAVLVQVANFLRTHVRSSDMTCRYGGEEFILVLPEASREITQLRAELMQKDARLLQLPFERQMLEAVTLSLGVAVYPQHGLDYDSILGAADAALYRAKNGGRDRVVIAD